MEKEPLFTLIRSLNKSEKRYFKLYCSIQQKEGEEMNYLRLFEAMEDMEGYDEAFILGKFKGEAFLQQLHVTKNYLYNLILRALRGFYHEALPELTFSNLLQNIEILYSKGLFSECLRQMNKLEKLASEAEDHIRLMQVYRLRLHLLQRHDTDKSYEKIREYWGKLHDETERYFNFIKIRKHTIAIYHLIGQVGIERNPRYGKQIEEIMKSLKNSGINEKNLSERSKQNLLSIDLAYYAFKGDEKNEIKTLQRSVQTYLDRPNVILNKPTMFISVLSNLAIGYTKYGHYARAMECYERIKGLLNEFRIKRTLQLETVQFTDSSNILLEVLNKRMEDEDEYKKEVEEIIQGIGKYKASSVRIEYLKLYFNAGYYFFLRSDFKNANRYINAFLDEWKEGARNDLYTAIAFMQLALFYSNGELELISYALPRIKRKLSKLGHFGETERSVLTFFDRIIDENSDKKRTILSDKLISALSPKRAGLVSWLQHFDLPGWVKSHFEK
ncbi:MAG TPA: hypothetical protein VI112_15715 [Bacteroidia bacterium]